MILHIYATNVINAVLISWHRVSGALLGVLALFSGFVSEMIVMGTIAPIYAYWQVWNSHL